MDDEPAMVPDPEAEVPEDWNEEEDGEFIPAMVPNPKCEEAPGCGKWDRPTKRNPEYKGKWSAPLIDNPKYVGPWAPKKIKNPAYFEDKTPANLEPMGAIGFEIWTMQNDILFDNIYIGHSIEDAAALKAATFDVKSPVEKAAEDESKPKHDHAHDHDTPKSPSDLKFLDDPVLYVREKVQLFLTIAQKDPLEAIRFVPEVAGGAGVLAVTIIVLLVSVLGASSSPAVQDKTKEAAAKVKATALDAKDQATAAVSSGAEKVQAEVNKRTTRSSGPAE